MLTNDLEAYYIFKDEPIRGCLLALRSIILEFDDQFNESFKWKLPFFTFNGKNFCYLHVQKKTQIVYIGFYKGSQLDHHLLYAGDRTVIKILQIDSEKDIPVDGIHEVLEMAIALYSQC